MNANPILLPLHPQIFGEWLAALGLLRVADSLCTGSRLHFGEQGRAVLSTTATEAELAARTIESANPARVTARIFTRVAAPDATTVRIGDDLFSVGEFHLHDRAVQLNDDAQAGFFVRMDALAGLEISHFFGAAMTECAGLKSPLKLWAGRITLPMVLAQLAEFVSGQPPTTSLPALLALHQQETKRLRFDNASEQFFEDGGHETEAGRDTRPVIEWLAFAGLSFFPPEAGFTALLESPRLLRASIWHCPLDTSAVLLALHTARFAASKTFAIASDGKLKKIRPSGAGRPFRATSLK